MPMIDLRQRSEDDIIRQLTISAGDELEVIVGDDTTTGDWTVEEVPDGLMDITKHEEDWITDDGNESGSLRFRFRIVRATEGTLRLAHTPKNSHDLADPDRSLITIAVRPL